MAKLTNLIWAIAIAGSLPATVASAQGQGSLSQAPKAQEESKAPQTIGIFLKGMVESVNSAVNKANGSASGKARGNPNGQPSELASATAAPSGQNGASGAEPLNGGWNQAPSISQTALASIFTNTPYDGTAKAHFPRVAVTVTDWSRSDCWTAVATLWRTKSRSESIAPFTVCWGTGLGFAVNNAAQLHLFMGQSAFEHTGNVRSTGPKPPMMAIPDRTPLRESQQQSFTGFIQQLVLDTGWQPGSPTNIWLVGFDPNGSKGGQVAAVRAGVAEESSSGELAEEARIQAGLAVSKQCKAQNFTQERYNRIVPGMSFDSVKKVIGCEPDADMTRRATSHVYYMWQATINNLVAAKAIEVFFDATGAKVAPLGSDFKFAKGF